MGCGSGSSQIGQGPQGQDAILTQLVTQYATAIASTFNISAVTEELITGTGTDDDMSITVSLSGKYILTFSCYVVNATNGTITFKAYQNSVELPEFKRELTTIAGESYGDVVCMSEPFTAAVGDVIEIFVITTNAGQSVKNRVMKISAVTTL